MKNKNSILKILLVFSLFFVINTSFCLAQVVEDEADEHDSVDQIIQTSQIDLNDCNIGIFVSSTRFVYTNKKITPNVTVTFKDGNEIIKLEKDIDYSVTYLNNVNVGKGIIKIEGKNQYTGSVTKYFEINPNISTSTVTAYVGKNFTRTAKSNGKVQYSSSNSKIAGVTSKGVVVPRKTGTVTIYAKSNGMTSKYTVKVVNPSLKLNYTSVYVHLGQKLTMKPTTSPGGESVKWSTSNSKIAAISSKGTVVGKKYGTVTITGKFTYNGKTYKKSCKVIVSNIKKVEGLSLYPSTGNSLKLTWKAVNGASGYQIYKSTSKNGSFKLIKTVSYKTTSYTDSAVSLSKRYYYKVRAYRTYNGKKYYGTTSGVINKKSGYGTPHYAVNMSNEFDNEVVFFSVTNNKLCDDLIILNKFKAYDTLKQTDMELSTIVWSKAYTGPFSDFPSSIVVKPGKTVYIGLVQRSDDGYFPENTRIEFAFKYGERQFTNYSTLNNSFYK